MPCEVNLKSWNVNSKAKFKLGMYSRGANFGIDIFRCGRSIPNWEYQYILTVFHSLKSYINESVYKAYL